MKKQSKNKIEYGDFQTPLDLTDKICNKLVQLNVFPDIIVEPTCGVGNFLQ
ncbi:MAG: SAM-dependent methyltransferase, partial [Crocosphaera sp.]